MYNYNQGEEFNEKEISSLFFGVTKLYFSKDNELRRLLYLFIKEMKVKETEVFMVIGSLTKDMTSLTEMYRANSIKVIAKIIDPLNIMAIEKHIKLSIVDKKPTVSRAAQIAGIVLYKSFPDIIKKWSNELYEKLNTSDVSHLTLALCKVIRANDNLALIKMFEQLCKKTFKNQILLQCQLIRYIKDLMIKSDMETKQRDMFIQYLKGFLSSMSYHESIVFEAAKSLCELNLTIGTSIEGVIAQLALMLESPKTITKYSVLRVLNMVSLKIPYLVDICSVELRNSISHSNRCVSSLAMSILLRICKENEVDEILNNIIKILPDVGDEFKVDMIKSVKLLVFRHPDTYKSVLQFLKKALRPYQVLEFRQEILDSIIYIINKVPNGREEALNIAMEFIEDCSFSNLLCKAIDTISEEIIKSKNPLVYLRYFYNRILLESDNVRVSAVSALGRIGINCSSIKQTVKDLLSKCLHDSSDQVRDKANFYIELLGKENAVATIQSIALPYININSLETYLLSNQESIKTSATIVKIPIELLTMPEKVDKKSTAPKINEDDLGAKKIEKVTVKVEVNPFHQSLTDFLQTTEPKVITEPTAEIQITLIKHIYKHAMVMQLIINNTLDDVIMKALQIAIENYQELPLAVESVTKIEEIKNGESATMYVLLKKKNIFVCGKIRGKISYKLCELDQSSKTEIGSFDETLMVEEMGIYLRDYIAPEKVVFNFDNKWSEISKDEVAEHKQNFQLPYKTLEDSISNTIKYLGLLPIAGTDKTKAGSKKHSLLLNGKLITGQLVLVKVMIGFTADLGCVASVVAKCNDETVSDIVLKSIC